MEDQVSPRIRLLLAAGVISALIPVVAQGRSAKSADAQAHPRPTTNRQVSRGELVFKQNCARCHDAPQSFPPQLAGTILRHMRVRASLSAQDEKAVLEFMNP
jgi:cytochrome c5